LISLCLHQGPLRRNGHWFPYVHIKTLYEAKVIDFLMFILRPSTRQWSLISLCLHQDPLRSNGYLFPYIHIKTICKAMVIDFFVISRPSAMQWSSIFLHQGPLRGHGHWFLSFRDPFLGIGLICFFFKKSEKKIISLSDRDPLHGNGHRIFGYRPFHRDWSNIFFKKSDFQKECGFSDQGPLHGNGHRILWIDLLHGIGLIYFFFFFFPKSKKKWCVGWIPSSW